MPWWSRLNGPHAPMGPVRVQRFLLGCRIQQYCHCKPEKSRYGIGYRASQRCAQNTCGGPHSPAPCETLSLTWYRPPRARASGPGSERTHRVWSLTPSVACGCGVQHAQQYSMVGITVWRKPGAVLNGAKACAALRSLTVYAPPEIALPTKSESWASTAPEYLFSSAPANAWFGVSACPIPPMMMLSACLTAKASASKIQRASASVIPSAGQLLHTGGDTQPRWQAQARTVLEVDEGRHRGDVVLLGGDVTLLDVHRDELRHTNQRITQSAAQHSLIRVTPRAIRAITATQRPQCHEPACTCAALL